MSKSKTKIESAKNILNKIDFALDLEDWSSCLGVIALAIILLVIGLGAFQVLVVTLRAIVVLIVLMTIVRLVIVAIASVASMIVAIFPTAMLTVA